MTIDNSFKSPDEESRANLGEVLHSRNNWTGYWPEYNATGNSTFVAAIFSNLLTATGAGARFLPCCFLCGTV
jgi:hypothetical protein